MHIHNAACHEVLLLVDGGDENDMHSWEFLTHYLQLAWSNLAKKTDNNCIAMLYLYDMHNIIYIYI